MPLFTVVDRDGDARVMQGAQAAEAVRTFLVGNEDRLYFSLRPRACTPAQLTKFIDTLEAGGPALDLFDEAGQGFDCAYRVQRHAVE
jgi:hypothetical protein